MKAIQIQVLSVSILFLNTATNYPLSHCLHKYKQSPNTALYVQNVCLATEVIPHFPYRSTAYQEQIKSKSPRTRFDLICS